MWLRVVAHLLPRAKAWRLTVDKYLRQFCEGLAGALGAPAKLFYDQAYEDTRPEVTRELAAWETHWGLQGSGITEQERRGRLSATWKALGGQSPRYIQDTLRGNGFDVYVHEWWVPGTEAAIGVKACATPRSPLLYLRREFTNTSLGVECGEALAACGEAFAECGNGVEPRGYPLVNKILQTAPDLLALCGETLAEAGEATMVCGSYEAFVTTLRPYSVPSDVTKWPYFLYIGAQDITGIAQVDPKRRDEFEALCLKICPAQQWLGILAEYV
ncbi:YmfQ family protein [bacterium]|nr:YmfQ family protein [bacterium]